MNVHENKEIIERSNATNDDMLGARSINPLGTLLPIVFIFGYRKFISPFKIGYASWNANLSILPTSRLSFRHHKYLTDIVFDRILYASPSKAPPRPITALC